jgi:HK97 family phage prohead protease
VTVPENPPRTNLYRADFGPSLELRDEEGKASVLAGHFARFNEWAEIRSAFEGHFLERFAPGSLVKTITERGSKMRVLFQHGKDAIGKQVLGEIVRLEEDPEGAVYEVELFDGIPQLILSGLKAGKYGSSFQFEVVKDEYDPRPRKSDYNPQGIAERTVVEAKVYEFGPVTFPAYEGASAGLRSVTDDFHPAVDRLAQDAERLEAIYRRGVSLSGVALPPEGATTAPVTSYGVLNSTTATTSNGTWAVDFSSAREASRREARRYERATQFIKTSPWAIHPDSLRVILQIVAERRSGYKPTPEEIRERLGVKQRQEEPIVVPVDVGEEDQPEPSVEDVAVIPVTGSIVPHADLFSEVSGATSIESLQAQFRASLSDESKRAILFNVDSPGGSASLVPEFAAEIMAARGTKPIVAVANTMAASAAYWIAAAADELVVSPSGQVGSVGVYAVHQDWSQYDTTLGVDTTLVSAGKFKTEGNEFQPLSDEGEAEMQRVVDAYYSMFVGALADSRATTRTTVKSEFGQGRMVMAADAVEKGMADRVGTFDETVQRLLADTPTERTEPEPPEVTTRPEPEPSEATTPRPRPQTRKEEPSWLL